MARGQLEDALETFKSETNVIHRLLGLTLVYHACGQSAQSNAAVREMIEKDADGKLIVLETRPIETKQAQTKQ